MASPPGGSRNTALSIGVFVGTTLLSQWLQHRLSLRSAGDDDYDDIFSSWQGSISDDDGDGGGGGGEADICGTPADNDARDVYHCKRRRRRLSFTRNEPYVYNHDHLSTDDDGSISASSSPPYDDDDDANESLMPKNRNWNHFERHHQPLVEGGNDIFRRTLSSTACSANGRGVMSLSGEDVLAAYEDDDDDEAFEDSDDISLSSEDQFV